jgi:hypothetical protein
MCMKTMAPQVGEPNPVIALAEKLVPISGNDTEKSMPRGLDSKSQLAKKTANVAHLATHN